MITVIDYLSDRFTDTENYVGKSVGWLSGLGAMMYFKFEMIDVTLLFTWVGLINTLLVFATSGISCVVVLIATDLYKYAKPKTVKFVKAKFIILKSKYCKNGNKKQSQIGEEKRA